MAISKDHAKQMLEDLVFTGDRAEDWVQDVWALSPLLGQSAASLKDVFDEMWTMLNEQQVEALLHHLQQQNPDLLDDPEVRSRWQALMNSESG